ncbi:hypothetical protein G6F56_011384 [Rhizopus delemar]|nr:hypothetical protein G6F56_011384 [Rhizopus delemar]
MNFEDIVDMDWLDSHSTHSINSPEYYTTEQEIFIKQEPEAEVTSFDCYQQPQMVVMPTIEQIKQLIEIAKKQLAVREELTPEPPTDIVLPDTVSPQSLVKPEKLSTRRRSECREDEKTSLQMMAERDGIDIKNLSSKERRQLRNKISARNFRVRRKGKFRV